MEKLCSYFTKLIFQTVDAEFDDSDPNELPSGEIPFTEIKRTIIEGKKADSDLLCMFCGADIWIYLISIFLHFLAF